MRKIKPTVLIVDDDEGVRSALKCVLSKKGYMVKEAENGKKALEKIAKNKPDVIILDARMPIMDGFKTCRCLRSGLETRDIPIIFCTATGIEEAKTRKIDVDDYIEKPFSMQDLYEKVHNLLKKK